MKLERRLLIFDQVEVPHLIPIPKNSWNQDLFMISAKCGYIQMGKKCHVSQFH